MNKALGKIPKADNVFKSIFSSFNNRMLKLAGAEVTPRPDSTSDEALAEWEASVRDIAERAYERAIIILKDDHPSYSKIRRMPIEDLNMSSAGDDTNSMRGEMGRIQREIGALRGELRAPGVTEGSTSTAGATAARTDAVETRRVEKKDATEPTDVVAAGIDLPNKPSAGDGTEIITQQYHPRPPPLEWSAIRELIDVNKCPKHKFITWHLKRGEESYHRRRYMNKALGLLPRSEQNAKSIFSGFNYKMLKLAGAEVTPRPDSTSDEALAKWEASVRDIAERAYRKAIIILKDDRPSYSKIRRMPIEDLNKSSAGDGTENVTQHSDPNTPH
jgi:hypothetical protein